jgi:hypothetical protein
VARIFVLALVALSLTTVDTAGRNVVRNATESTTWSGSVRDGLNTSGPPECAPGCDRFDVTVDLPSSIWDRRDGGLEVSIR